MSRRGTYVVLGLSVVACTAYSALLWWLWWSIAENARLACVACTGRPDACADVARLVERRR